MMKIKTQILENWILSLSGRNLCLVFLFAVQFFSSQIVVKDNTTFVGLENVMTADSVSDSETKEGKAVVYISSGTTIVNDQKVISYKTLAVQNLEPGLDRKGQTFAQVSDAHKKLKDKSVKKVKPNPAKPTLEKPQVYYSSNKSDSQFSSHSSSISFAIPAQVGKDKSQSYASVFVWKPPILRSASQSVDSSVDFEIYHISLWSFSIRPPPFLA